MTVDSSGDSVWDILGWFLVTFAVGGVIIAVIVNFWPTSESAAGCESIDISRDYGHSPLHPEAAVLADIPPGTVVEKYNVETGFRKRVVILSAPRFSSTTCGWQVSVADTDERVFLNPEYLGDMGIVPYTSDRWNRVNFALVVPSGAGDGPLLDGMGSCPEGMDRSANGWCQPSQSEPSTPIPTPPPGS